VLEPAAASSERHERFVRRVRESGEVWGLKSDAGWATAPSNEHDESSVMPFWSDRAYAAQCAREGWGDYVPTPIPLDLFVQYWLPGMNGDGVLVGTNWNVHLVGREVKSLDLLTELSA